jgi:NADH:ubiquinone oxidoreductase subunit 6 (subunit J)
LDVADVQNGAAVEVEIYIVAVAVLIAVVIGVIETSDNQTSSLKRDVLVDLVARRLAV